MREFINSIYLYQPFSLIFEYNFILIPCYKSSRYKYIIFFNTNNKNKFYEAVRFPTNYKRPTIINLQMVRKEIRINL